jgi:hypothetical protein
MIRLLQNVLMTRSRLVFACAGLLTMTTALASAQTAVPPPALSHLLFVTHAKPETSLSVSFCVARRPVTTTRVGIEAVAEARMTTAIAVEVAVPFEALVGAPGPRASGLGDVAIGVKAALRNREPRMRLTAGIVVSLPTGAAIWGFGEGTTVFKPYLAMASSSKRWEIQADVGAEIPQLRYRTDPVRYVSYDVVAAARLGDAWLAGIGVRGTDAAFAITPQLAWRVSRALTLNGGVKVPLNPPRPFATDTTVWTASAVWARR